jgi:uncharacterized protein (TIGR02001 family)
MARLIMQRFLLSSRCYLACVVACASSLAVPEAVAETSVSGSIGATSDFVFRGLSYTRGDPAVQASLDVEFPTGFYAGTFLSSTNPNPGSSPSAEVDLWAGYHHSFSEWISTDFRYTHYMYPDDPRAADYDRDELTATVGLRNTLFFSAVFSPNTDAIASAPGISTGDAWAVELSARHQISTRWSISAGIGRYLLEEIYAADYDYWGATLSADFSPMEVHIALLGADDTAEQIFSSRAAGQRIAVTLLYRFSSNR